MFKAKVTPRLVVQVIDGNDNREVHYILASGIIDRAGVTAEYHVITETLKGDHVAVVAETLTLDTLQEAFGPDVATAVRMNLGLNPAKVAQPIPHKLNPRQLQAAKMMKAVNDTLRR